MIKSLKNVKRVILETKIVNTLMLNGQKSTGEKILLKFSKNLQKTSNKSFKKLVQLSIINSTSAFKLNEQIVKKGKRRAVRHIPSFVSKDSLRIMISLKQIKRLAIQNKNSSQFYQGLATETFMASFFEGQSAEKKAELQKQILTNKRYLANF